MYTSLLAHCTWLPCLLVLYFGMRLVYLSLEFSRQLSSQHMYMCYVLKPELVHLESQYMITINYYNKINKIIIH